jgi:hypothetical protein
MAIKDYESTNSRRLSDLWGHAVVIIAEDTSNFRLSTPIALTCEI